MEESNELRILKIKYKGLLEEYSILLDKFIEIKEKEKRLGELADNLSEDIQG